MSFYDIYEKYKRFDFDAYFQKITSEDIEGVLKKDHINNLDFLALLSENAEPYLEEMARKSQLLSLKHFGKAITLYTPMYISNYCVNTCVYCSYNCKNNIMRNKLSIDEIRKEAEAISKTGLRHILILTGESKVHTPITYIIDAIHVLKEYFDSIAIEIYPLTEEEYRQVVDAGVDGVTVYQEVYDERIYDKLHISGPKKNYGFRLNAPERACKSEIRSVNIGALLGLNHWREEAFLTGIHASYLQRKYPGVEFSISLPRIRPHIGVFEDVYPVMDKHFVQILLSLKLFLPHVGITMSTREKQGFRDNLFPLGITKMSAGVSTNVGGHSGEATGDSQFEISDVRSVDEIRDMLLSRGYQPVLKDWSRF